MKHPHQSKTIIHLLLTLLLAGLATACTGSEPPPEPVATPIPESVSEAPATAEPTNEVSEEATVAPIEEIATVVVEPTATEVVIEEEPAPSNQTLSAVVPVNSIVLRAGPSTLFDQLATYSQGTVVTVLSKAKGDDWVQVNAPDGQTGWMAQQFLEIEGDLALLDTQFWTDIAAVIIGGQVTDTDGGPIDGVNVALFPEGDESQRIDVYSDANGEFYGYLPAETGGTWDVQIVGINCNSRIMDANCDLSGYVLFYGRELVTLPQTDPLAFQYAALDPVAQILEGTVQANSIILREGPSTIYPRLGSYPEGTIVTMLSIAPGGDWVKVETPDGLTGWMSPTFLAYFGDKYSLALEENIGGIVIGGQVVDTDGIAIDGINIAVLQGEQRTDVYSDREGFFYAYLPDGSAGEWDVQAVGVNCTSRIVDANCNLAGFAPLDVQEFVTLPLGSPLIFTYEVTDPIGLPNEIPTDIVIDNQDPVVQVIGLWYGGDGGQSFNADCLWTPPGLGNVVQLEPTLPVAGSYEIFVWGCGDPNFDQAELTSYTIFSQVGSGAAPAVVQADLKHNPGQWISLGTHYLETNPMIQIPATVQGNVVVDAFQFSYRSVDNITALPTPIPDEPLVTNNPPSPIVQIAGGDLGKRLGVVDPFLNSIPLRSSEEVTVDDCQTFPREGCGGSVTASRVVMEFTGSNPFQATYLVSTDYQRMTLEQVPATLQDRQLIYMTGWQAGRSFGIYRYPDDSWHLLGSDVDGFASSIPLEPEQIGALQIFIQNYNSLGGAASAFTTASGLELRLYGFGSATEMSAGDRPAFEAFGTQLAELVWP